MMRPDFASFFFCTIFISLGFVPFFGSNFAFAEVHDYTHAIVTTSTGKEIFVEVADTVEKRSLGLGKRSGLENGWGMLFVFEKRKQHGFWMKDMQFPLDIIWLENHRIVHILRNVQPAKSGDFPPVMTPPVAGNFVLEIDAGRADELKLQVGQRLKYQF